MHKVPIGNQECSCLCQICPSLNDLFGLKSGFLLQGAPPKRTFPSPESSLIIKLAIYLSANFALAPCTGVAGLQILLAMAMQ